MSWQRTPRHAARRDEAARNALVAQWVWLVAHVQTALRARLSALSDDLAYDAGIDALIRAAELWDESRGIQFSTYAMNAIRNNIIHKNQQATRRKSRCPTLPLVEAPQIAVREGERNESPVTPQMVQAAACTLPGLLPHILHLRYCNGLTLKGVAQRIGTSRETARKKINEALALLRQRLSHHD